MLEPTATNHHGVRDTEVRERVSLARFLRKSATPGPVLIIRTLKQAGGFQKTVNLRAGQLNVVDASAKNELSVIHSALSSASPEHSLRLGARELAHTEINCVVGPLRVVSLSISAHALITDAVPARVATSLIERVGLTDRKNMPFQFLSPCEKQRLRLALSLYSPCPVIYFDEPLAGLSTEWREPMAELMLEVARGSSQIFVVTTEKRLPQAWQSLKTSEKGRVATTANQDPFGLSLAEYKVREVSQALEKLLNIQAHDSRADLQVIITRPQTVSKSLQRGIARDLNSTEIMRTEIIRNPGFDSAPGPLVRVGRREISRARKPTVRRYIRSSHLTSVTLFERFMRLPMFSKPIALWEAARSRWEEQHRVARTTLPAVRISMLRRRDYVLHTFIVPTILVMLIAVAVNFIY